MILYRLINTYRDETSYEVLDYDLNNFNILMLKSGKKYNKKLPKEFKIYVNTKNTLTDFLQNPLSLPIVSKKLLDKIYPYIRDSVELFQAPIYDYKSRKLIKDFYILNITKVISALDLGHSDIIYDNINGKKIVVYINRYSLLNIPPDVNIFRPKENVKDIFFSETLFKAMEGENIKGIGFFKENSS